MSFFVSTYLPTYYITRLKLLVISINEQAMLVARLVCLVSTCLLTF